MEDYFSIYLAYTDFFQQSVSVLAAYYRGRLNRHSTFYQIHWILENFGILCKHFGTVTQGWTPFFPSMKTLLMLNMDTESIIEAK